VAKNSSLVQISVDFFNLRILVVDFSLHQRIHNRPCMHIFLQFLIEVLVELKSYVDLRLFLLSEVVRVLTNRCLHFTGVGVLELLDSLHILVARYGIELSKSCTCFH